MNQTTRFLGSVCVTDHLFRSMQQWPTKDNGQQRKCVNLPLIAQCSFFDIDNLTPKDKQSKNICSQNAKNKLQQSQTDFQDHLSLPIVLPCTAASRSSKLSVRWWDHLRWPLFDQIWAPICNGWGTIRTIKAFATNTGVNCGANVFQMQTCKSRHIHKEDQATTEEVSSSIHRCHSQREEDFGWAVWHMQVQKQSNWWKLRCFWNQDPVNQHRCPRRMVELSVTVQESFWTLKDRHWQQQAHGSVNFFALCSKATLLQCSRHQI